MIYLFPHSIVKDIGNNIIEESSFRSVNVEGPPKPSSPAASRRMKANISKGTIPELRLRKALWYAGLRGYRLNWTKATGSPDIAFIGKRIAIFINGCFWHNCPHCKKRLPKANRQFWKRKLDENVKRDRRTKMDLESVGWEVLIVWECEIRDKLDEVVNRIRDVHTRQ